MTFLSPAVSLYLYKSTIRPCMEYCCHACTSTPSFYMELLDELQKPICRAINPSHAASLEPSAHHRHVVSLSLFYSYGFGRCSLELSQLVVILILDFSVLFCFSVLLFWFILVLDFSDFSILGFVFLFLFFFCTDDEFAVNSEIFVLSSILFIYLNIRLKIRWIYSVDLFLLFILKMISWKRIPRCYKDAYVNSFFPRIALKFTNRLWKSLPIECYPLTYDLNGFKSRINRHHFTVGYF